ncbi:MAG: magnesium/cobalt transporter CorA [Cytophagales bacterium]|nr:magnesium/cobalt transporter CorA [Cytophagales bacterium]
MNPLDLTRPDKLILKGLKTLGSLSSVLYADQKTEAKAKAELTFIGEKKLDQVRSQLFTYNETEQNRKEKIRTFNFLNNPEPDKFYWLNFYGIHDVKLLQKLSEKAGLHRLTLRQILDTTQRPKVEAYENYLFFSVKSIIKEDSGNLNIEQLSFVLGEQYVISFQEEEGDHFEGIRSKLKEGVGFIRKKKSDYLLSQLLDAILDNYFETLDKMNKEISHMEPVIINAPHKGLLIQLEAHKRSAFLLKKSLVPFKEALTQINGHKPRLIEEENLRLFSYLGNSAIAALEEADTILKTLEGLTNIYFASLSQKMNEAMRVLTTVATIFIPLTFIAGIYGMNFKNMPELDYQYGYHIAWGVMICLAVGMAAYFRRKKWV